MGGWSGGIWGGWICSGGLVLVCGLCWWMVLLGMVWTCLS